METKTRKSGLFKTVDLQGHKFKDAGNFLKCLPSTPRIWNKEPSFLGKD